MSRLLNRVREAVRTRHYSIRTEEAYLRRNREFLTVCGARSFHLLENCAVT